MSTLEYIDRRGTDCEKWDEQTPSFGEEGLHAMWVADMDFKVPACVQKALHEYVDMGAFGYMSIRDNYYQAFINWEKNHHGLEVKKDWIRFSPGVIAAFNWIIQFMTEKKDAVIVMTPVYYPFFRAVENNDRTLVTSELINDHGIYTIDFEDFEQKIVDNQAKLFIMCSPHNPVGRVWTAEEVDRIIAICKKHHVFIIADEIHHDLLAEGVHHVPTLGRNNYWDNIIMVTAPSKTFNLAGGQNSLVVIPDEGLRKKWDIYTNGIRVLFGNAFGYVACEAAYEGGEEWYQDVKKQIWSNYEYLKHTFAEKLPGAVVSPLEGTYLCWIDLRACIDPEKTKELIQKRCRLAVDFGEWFGGDQFKGFIRMNLATSLKNVQIAVEAICKNV